MATTGLTQGGIASGRHTKVAMRYWSNGRIPDCHSGDRGSIPLYRTSGDKPKWGDRVFRILFATILVVGALIMSASPASASGVERWIGPVGPHDLRLPIFYDPFFDGYSHCDNTYVAERVNPTASGKTHIDVCVMKCRTVHVRTVNGVVHRVNEALYPDEVNLISNRIKNRMDGPDHNILVVQQDGAGLREIDVRNIVDFNVFETPFCRLEMATAPYFLGPAFPGLFRSNLGQ